MPVRVAAPALRRVLRSMAFLAERHQVGVTQRDRRVVQVLRRKMHLVVHMDRRFDQPFAQADLTEPALLLQERRTALSPCLRCVESLDIRI